MRTLTLALLTVFGVDAADGQSSLTPPVSGTSMPPASQPLRIGEDSLENADPGRRFTKPPEIPSPIAVQGTFSLPTAGDCEGTYGGPLELAQLLQLACENNPTLKQAQYQISAQLATALEAGLYPNPTVTLVNEQLGIKGNYAEYSVAEFEQKIVTADKLELSRNKYLQRAKVAEHLAVAQRFRVCTDVRIHFYRALASTERVRLFGELVKSAEDGVKTAREEYNLGQSTAVDIRRANIELQRTRLMQLQAQNELQQHLAELSALTGVAFTNPQLVGELEIEPIVPSFDAEYARIRTQSPEVLAAHAKLREDYITLKRELAEPVPDLFVGGGPGYNFDADESIANAYLRIELNIFDRNQGNIRKQELNIFRQQAEIRRTELELRSRLATQFQTLIQAMTEITEYEGLIVPEAREAYRLELEAYREDRQDWPEVLTAQRDFTQRRLELIGHQLDAQTSRAMIGGFLLHGGLQVPMNPVPPGHLDATPDPR